MMDLASEESARQVLRALRIRQTVERLAATRLFLAWPGLSGSALVAALAAVDVPIHRRTAYRLFALLRSPAGGLARWRVVGPNWVCWSCGRALEPVAEATSQALRGMGVLPLDLGGYCAACQAALVGDASRQGSPAGRVAPPGRNRPAAIVPVRDLYQNPNLLRDLLGSSRRLPGRDYVVANLAEHPRAGPSEIHRLLGEELPIAPGLRSVKRVSSALRGPKARMLFASLGAIGWSCTACAAWGQVTRAAPVFDAAPTGFWPTDVRGLCPSCLEYASSPAGSEAED